MLQTFNRQLPGLPLCISCRMLKKRLHIHLHHHHLLVLCIMLCWDMAPAGDLTMLGF